MPHRRPAPMSSILSAGGLALLAVLSLGEAHAQGGPPPAPPVQVSAPLAQRV
ncbi:MAG: efflux transporter periplasmic adaptor subunit, partial [Methylobacterium sp.]|nr:efflux transporter periplasmic adaptor subunit [Methylobacterium sp.]